MLRLTAIYALSLLFVILGCAAKNIPHDFGRTAIRYEQEKPLSKLIQVMTALGYPIDFKDEDAGVINTGWYSLTAQRGLLKIPYAIQLRALFNIKPSGVIEMGFESQASYGSALGGQYWQPISASDGEGLKVANKEFERVRNAIIDNFGEIVKP